MLVIKNVSDKSLENSVEDVLAIPKPQDFAHKIVSIKKDDGRAAQHHLHELKGTISRVRAAVAALQNGYRFDDDEAPKLIGLLAESVAVLENEMNTWEKIYT